MVSPFDGEIGNPLFVGRRFAARDERANRRGQSYFEFRPGLGQDLPHASRAGASISRKLGFTFRLHAYQ